MDLDIANIRRVFFEKVPVHVQSSLAEVAFMRNHMEISAYMDHVSQAMILDLHSFVLGHPVQRIDVDKKWPRDWWQAVRERWFPRWWLTRWPVRYETVSIHEQIYFTCPHLDIKTHGPHVSFLENGPKRGQN